MSASSQGKPTETVDHKHRFSPSGLSLQLLGCRFFLVLGKCSGYAPTGAPTLSADAISAFANSNRSASRSYRDCDSVALHLQLLEPPASRIASLEQTAEPSLLTALAVPCKVELRFFGMWQALGNENVACQRFSNGQDKFTCNSGFHNITKSTCRKASAHEIGVGVNRQKNKPRFTS